MQRFGTAISNIFLEIAFDLILIDTKYQHKLSTNYENDGLIERFHLTIRYYEQYPFSNYEKGEKFDFQNKT